MLSKSFYPIIICLFISATRALTTPLNVRLAHLLLLEGDRIHEAALDAQTLRDLEKPYPLQSVRIDGICDDFKRNSACTAEASRLGFLEILILVV